MLNHFKAKFPDFSAIFFAEIENPKLKRLISLSLIIFLFAYSLFFRTCNIADNFFLYGDQIRDWRLVQGGFSDLPLVGTPRGLDGTYSFGPIFYWLLWLIRVILGPFFENLPHAGGIGLAFLHALADSFLLFAMIKTRVPIVSAFTIGLILVSSPFEGSLSRLVWNPGLAVSFVNVTAALVLLAGKKPSLLECALFGFTLNHYMVIQHNKFRSNSIPIYCHQFQKELNLYINFCTASTDNIDE